MDLDFDFMHPDLFPPGEKDLFFSEKKSAIENQVPLLVGNCDGPAVAENMNRRAGLSVFDGAEQTPGGEVPEPKAFCLGHGDESLSVGSDGKILDGALGSLEASYQFTVLGIKNHDGVFIGSDGKPAAIIGKNELVKDTAGQFEGLLPSGVGGPESCPVWPEDLGNGSTSGSQNEFGFVGFDSGNGP